jgi:hypothetical protein
MSTNRNITINVEPELYVGFNKLCSVSGANKNEYGKALIAYAIEHHLVAGQNTLQHQAWLAAIKEGTVPLPKIGLEIKAGPPSTLRIFSAEDPHFARAAEEAPHYPTKRPRRA